MKHKERIIWIGSLVIILAVSLLVIHQYQTKLSNSEQIKTSLSNDKTKLQQQNGDYVTQVAELESDREDFSYGDEFTFYKNDEKSNKNPTAISVVTKYLEATKTNDYDTWLSTLTTEKQKGFSRERNQEFGVISLDILDIHYQTDTGYKHNILKSERAIEKGLTADNIAEIFAFYEVKYDGTKVPSNGGKIGWGFTLIRDDKNSPWYIQEWGYGYGGI